MPASRSVPSLSTTLRFADLDLHHQGRKFHTTVNLVPHGASEWRSKQSEWLQKIEVIWNSRTMIFRFAVLVGERRPVAIVYSLPDRLIEMRGWHPLEGRPSKMDILHGRVHFWSITHSAAPGK